MVPPLHNPVYILIAKISTLENWFYDNYMVHNPCKCEFIGFGKTNENEVFTYCEI